MAQPEYACGCAWCRRRAAEARWAKAADGKAAGAALRAAERRLWARHRKALRASQVLAMPGPLALWIADGCDRSRRLTPAQRQQALEWLLLESTLPPQDAPRLRIWMFGDSRNARRRDAMLGAAIGAEGLSNGVVAATERFLKSLTRSGSVAAPHAAPARPSKGGDACVSL